MKADTVDLAAIFGKQVRYMVPLFQRPYVWTQADQWEPLWEDVRIVADRQLDDTPENDSIPHFLGAVVLEQALVQSGMIESRSVIDGQQRLTTLQVLLAAARSLAIEHGLEGAGQMFEKLLFNESFLVKSDADRFKVVPTERDRASFRDSMQGDGASSSGGHRIHQAYRFFRSAIHTWATDGDPAEVGLRMEALSTTLWKRLVVVTIDLDPGDNAQIIFETLNARGTPLLAGDLIKNHLFQVATIQGADIDQLYLQHWQSLDSDWWREDVQQGRLRRPRLDIFLNHWLAMRTGGEIVSHQLFPEFKRYLTDGSKLADAVLTDLARYAKVFESFEMEPQTTQFGRFLYRLGVMEVTTAYPALLWMIGPDGIVDVDERVSALDAIESWLVRRMLTRATTKNYNVVFLALLKAIRAGPTEGRQAGQDVARFLAGLSGESQVWPSAASMLGALRGLPAYTSITRPRLRMVLEALEHGLRTGLTENVALPTNLTVEHVLPQNWAPHWPLPHTSDPNLARAQREGAKHTLGNLTLVTGKLNPSMSNAGWREKQEALRTYSVMLISSDLREAETWDESAIAERGERLARLAVATWPRPDDVFDSPEPAAVEVARSVAPAPAAVGSANPGSIPEALSRLVEMRASPGIASLTYRFAQEAIAREGVELRVQQSKGDPYYFQVRHPRFGQVVAYVHPRPAELHIEFRLPSETFAPEPATHREHLYGIVLKVRQLSDLELATRLLGEALDQQS